MGTQFRPYDTNEQEYAGVASTAEPYVQPIDRDHNYPQKYPLPIDRYRIDYWRPVVAPGSIDVEALYERATQGWKRCNWETKRKWAFRPSQNSQPWNWAAANGHPSGKVGVTGELVTEEMDPELGGGQTILLCHLPAISKL